MNDVIMVSIIGILAAIMALWMVLRKLSYIDYNLTVVKNDVADVKRNCREIQRKIQTDYNLDQVCKGCKHFDASALEIGCDRGYCKLTGRAQLPGETRCKMYVKKRRE